MPARDNGFVARHYVPLADLDPRVADAMLEVLGGEEIAAYAEPSSGSMGGYLEVRLPSSPVDRLWVDRERHARAAVLLREHANASPMSVPFTTPSGPAGPSTPAQPADMSAVDAAWAQLVADYDTTFDDATHSWPDREDLASPDAPDAPSGAVADGQPPLPFDEPEAGPPPGSPVPRRIIRPAENRPGAWSEPAAVEPSYEYDPLSVLDERFIPPTPPRLPAMRGSTKAAIAAIVVGLALVIGHSFGVWMPGGVALGVLAVVGGFVALVAGMRPDRSDDDSDDGAVV
jgi:hypothetical protein